MSCRRATAAALGVALAAIAAQRAGAGEAPLQVYQLVRSLELVQDRVASGDQAALPMQRKLLELIDQKLLASSKEELSQPVNFRAVLVYAMSGGNPATLETVIGELSLSEADSRKAIGILSYLKGGSKAAIVSLKPVDPMAEPQELGAFLALIKGSVDGLEDPKAALKLLDKARLLAPGTLVEEAALRRSMPFKAALGDAPGFLHTCDQYVSAYIRSPYASQFADAFVDGVVRLHDTIDRQALDAVIKGMTSEQQHVIYLRIARRAAIAGLMDLSQFASGAAAGSNGDAAADPRGLLYASLSGIATEPIDELKSTIARIDRAKLSAGDQQLLAAVETLSDAIVREPDAPKSVPDPAPLVIEAPKPPAEPAKAAEPAPAGDVSDIPVDAAPGQNLPAADGAAAPAGPDTKEPAADAAAQNNAAAPTQPTDQAAPGSAGQATLPVPTASEAATTADSGDPNDAASAAIAEGRKKLQEIDAILAKAVQ